MSDEAERQQARLIQALLDPRRYPHPVERVECIETHISTVLLAGAYAYKIKKPLNLGFLDFSTLAQRAFYCAEEVRLNSRLAEGIYLRTVPIAGTPDAPRLDGSGPPIEHAVLMRRFPQEGLLDRRIGGLPPSFMDVLAARVARFHADIARAPDGSPHGTPEAVAAPVRENFRQLDALVQDAALRARLQTLAATAEAQLAQLHARLSARRAEGFVRECHGDMHLGNMALWDGQLIIFDGIEFNPHLYWIDVMSEVAFVTMDLQERGFPTHAHRFLNSYLECSGDYAGLTVLPFYQSYRALVRAKVHAIRASQADTSAAEAQACWQRCRDYVKLARRYAQARQGRLLITHGLSGSGKTTLTQRLVDRNGAIRLRSDIERKRLHGLTAQARSASGIAQGLYGPQASARTYARLAELAGELVQAGWPVIVDATFLQREQRDRFRDLARTLGAPFHILDFRARPELLRGRIAKRLASGKDASEADLAVLEHQLRTAVPLGEDEALYTRFIDAESGAGLDEAEAALH